MALKSSPRRVSQARKTIHGPYLRRKRMAQLRLRIIKLKSDIKSSKLARDRLLNRVSRAPSWGLSVHLRLEARTLAENEGKASDELALYRKELAKLKKKTY
ncbi:hypothetical protein KKE06_00700 [Candidatus Micrarchaeota archaeon]|nr:hypothetical protein [Candidatus Micrarchaeota archaeon]MBU1930125.1 hypothetical protein [Candidatus Micrarchaeota archaeon]